MKLNSHLSKVLSYQSFGFLAIIALCWLNSLLGLPALILDGDVGMTDLRSPVLQMLLILMVWLLVSASTRRGLDRLKHLEQFLHVCAWCRRIDSKGKWLAMEKFLAQGLDTTTTHGICPDCMVKHAESLGQKKQVEVIPGKQQPAT